MATMTTFRKLQRGKETVRGNAVAATARWLGDMTLKEANQYYVPQYPYGVLSQYYTPGFQIAKAAEIAYASDLTYEEIIDFLEMGVKGGVTPTGGGADKTWTFTHPVAADPAPTTFTIELANSDGSTTYNREVEYCFAKKLGISAAINEQMKFTADLVGRQVIDSTVTGGLALPAAWETAQSNLLKVYTANTWAGLAPGTQIAGSIVDLNLEIVTGLIEGKYLSGNLYFDNYKPGALGIDLTMTLEFDAVSDAEQELVRTRGLRFVHLVVSGSLVSALNKTIDIKMCCFHAEDSIQEMFGDREGTDTVKFHLLGAYDPTVAKDVEIVVINSLAAIL
jgi:hypothetical protein